MDAEANPDLYGLRRSGRAPTRKSYVTEDDDDANEDEEVEDEENDILPDESEDDDDDFGGRQTRKRRPQSESVWGPPVRMSSRQSSRVTNYADDYHGISDDDVFEDEAYDVVPATEPAEELDQIEGVFGHERDEAHLDDPEDIPTQNMRFVIKWRGYSHLHDTHELYDFLQRFPGAKRVSNYIKSVWQPLHDISTNPDATREDVEALQIQRERQRELLELFRTVERVIAQRDSPPTKDVPYALSLIHI